MCCTFGYSVINLIWNKQYVFFIKYIMCVSNIYIYIYISKQSQALIYCIWRVSETTRASSDVYCQSNNDNNTRTSCTFYEKSLQVNHRQNTQKERARYCEMGRETERGVRRGYLSGTVIFGFDHHPKST